jgi:hypothetical protein
MVEIMNETRIEFKATRAIGFCIADYDVDIRQQLEFFKFLGIRDLRKPDFTRQGLDESFKKIKEESITASCHPAEKLLIFVYYSGHGQMYDD